MVNILIDVGVVAFLVLLFCLGWKKGLLLSLCGLAVVIVSFIGANILANVLAEPVADLIQPKLEKTIVENVVKPDSGLALELPADLELPEDFKLPDNFEIPEDWELPEGFEIPFDELKQMGGVIGQIAEELEDSLGTSFSGAVSELANKAAHALAVQIAHVAILIIAFIVLLIVLTIILHALDLVAKLPGLNFCNGLGGGVIGLLKGVIFLFVVAWVVRLIPEEMIPNGVVEKTVVFRFFLHTNPIALLSAIGTARQR